MNKIKCKDCKYCKQVGRAAFTCKNLGCGRKLYYCEHPDILQKQDKWGYKINNFIDYGTSNSEESPLQLKTSKKWCPLKGECDNEC